MKRFILCVLSLFLLIPAAFSFDYSAKFYPFIGYMNFHEAINLKDTIMIGIGFNQKVDETFRLDLQAGFMPSEYVIAGTSVPVLYGSLNGQYLLPKACCGVSPFLTAGLSLFSYDGKIDNGIEFGAGLLTISKTNVEHKFEVKARYNPGDKQSDILAIFSLGLSPINEAKPEPVAAKQTEPVKEKIQIEEIKKEIPENSMIVIEEEQEPTLIKPVPPVIEEPKKQEIKKQQIIQVIKEVKKSPTLTFLSTKKIVMNRFFYNSATIGEPGVSFVKDAATILKGDPKLKAIITGYANSFERKPDFLSLQRAEEVKKELIKKYKISNQTIKARSGGYKAAGNNNYLNRRVEISFYYEN
jgi:outer membrane protein OmpA-like peptidoglycan-associated protein